LPINPTGKEKRGDPFNSILIEHRKEEVNINGEGGKKKTMT